jgi:hypothetical protein
MFDELDRLREAPELHHLLSHYAELARPDRQVWLDRCMQMEGCDARRLIRFHGELLAYGWIEQNTGVVTTVREGAAPGCYRLTPAGLRALRQVAEQAA